MTLRLKRRGDGVHRLRLAGSRFLEWVAIAARHGWIGDLAKANATLALTRRGGKRMRTMLLSRRLRGLNLPYGPAAFALGLAPDPSLQWAVPDPRRPRRRRRGPPATIRNRH